MKKILLTIVPSLLVLSFNSLFAQAPAITYPSPQNYAAGTAISALIPVNTGGLVPGVLFGQTSTLASFGGGFFAGIVTDTAHNLYIADHNSNVIRKISPSGIATIFAGSGNPGSTNGTGTAASFNSPQGLAIDAAGNIYVADGNNNQVRKITPFAIVTTVAGSGVAGHVNGSSTAASFNGPNNIAVDHSGNIYVAEYSNNDIRKITAGGTVSTLAGSITAGSSDGTGAAASFSGPRGIAIDINGNLYVADANNNTIRKISAAGAVITLAGIPGSSGATNGPGASATFTTPSGVAVDAGGNVYVADANNLLIRKVSPAGVVSTLAGGGAGGLDGTGTEAGFNSPDDVAIDAAGNLYVYDSGSVRKVTAAGYSLNPALPAGLTLNATTGAISGIPLLAAPAANYAITAYNSNGSSTATINITVTGTITSPPPAIAAPNISYSSPHSYTAGTAITALTPANTGGAVPGVLYGQTTTFATGLGQSLGIVTDAAGNVYYADNGNVIRKFTSSGVASILAGSGIAGSANGTGTAASFNNPQSLAIDLSGNIYVADAGNNLIRKINPAGVVSTLAGRGIAGRNDGNGTMASFNNPTGITVDNFGNVYVADFNNNIIRKINAAGVVSTLAGSTAGYADGMGTAANFNQPYGVAADGSGNIYVTDLQNFLIRKINPAGLVSTLAGTVGSPGSANGTGTAAGFAYPVGLTTDILGNIYVADSHNSITNNTIRKITPAGVVSTLAGGAPGGSIDGTGSAAGFAMPQGVTTDGIGDLYVTDNGNIRKVSAAGYSLGPNLPAGLSFDATTGTISGTPLLAAAVANYNITAYNIGGSNTAVVNITVTGTITPPPPAVAAPHVTYSSPHSYPAGTAITKLNSANSGGAVPGVLYGQTTTFASGFGNSYGIVTDAGGNVYYADFGNVIRKITPAGISSIFAGSGNAGLVNGIGTAASFNQPMGLAIDASGNIYVADANNNVIRKISPAGVVTTLAGTGVAGRNDGPRATSSFNNPFGLTIDNYGNLYVTDYNSNNIRKISATGVVSTLAGNGIAGYADGTGAAAGFNGPFGITIDGSGNLYVADIQNYVIRKVTPSGVVTTLAGNPGNTGSADGTGVSASFNRPTGVTIDASGNIYVTDFSNNLIRKVTQTGVVSTLAGNGGGSDLDGTGVEAAFSAPQAITNDGAGNLYITEAGIIRKVSAVGYSESPALPPGLTFDATTGGAISGTPTLATAATNYVVSAFNIGGSNIATINITVTGAITPPVPPAAPNISYTTPHTYTAGTGISTLSPTNTGGAVPGVLYGQTTTFATGLGDSYGIVLDAAGNIYFADNSFNVIRKILPSGITSTFAGSGVAGAANGTGTAAGFNQPHGLAIDASGNIYVADGANNLIRKITPAGVVSTFAGNGAAGRADGTGIAASFNNPVGLAIDAFGNLYVADSNNNMIRKISSGGIVSTLAGNGTEALVDGTGTSASFAVPYGVAVDGAGNVYVADSFNFAVRKISPGGVVTTLAGSPGNRGFANGPGAAAGFAFPVGLVLDASGNIYVTDSNDFYSNNLVREITPVGMVSTFAGGGPGGSDGTGTQAGFSNPWGISMDAAGSLYIADGGQIRKVSAVGYSLGSSLPVGLSFDSTTGAISGTPALAAPAANFNVTAYNLGGSSTATVNITVTGSITPPPPPVAAPNISYATPQSYTAGTAISTLSPTNTGGAVPGVLYGQTTTVATGFGQGLAVVTDAAGNVYYADNSYNVIRKITPSGVASIFAGSGNPGSANGAGTAASFSSPLGMAIDASGNIYVGDFGNNLIRKINPAGTVSTFAGSGVAGHNDGLGTSTSFNGPTGLAVDAYGNVYVADQRNEMIRKISPSGIVSTLAGSGAQSFADGSGTTASFNTPWGIAVDGAGNIYVADAGNFVIRKVSPLGVVSTLAGTAGSNGSLNGTGAAASFSSPEGVAVDASGNLYIADAQSNVPGNEIRKITPAGVVTTLAGNGSTIPNDGTGTAASFGFPQGIALATNGYLYITGNDGEIRKVSPVGYNLSPALPLGLNFDGTSGAITGTPVSAVAAKNYIVSAYNLGGSSTATVNITVTGTATVPAAVSAPVISYTGPQTYATGTVITPLVPANSGGAVPATIYGQTTTFAGNSIAGGNDGTGTAASFNSPAALAADPFGNIYVADHNNHVIRRISSTGVVTTLAGSGSPGYADGTGVAASFYNPAGVAADNYGFVYVADTWNQVIRKISPLGVVTTLAGTAGSIGAADGTGAAASFNYPSNLTVDASRNLYVSDQGNNLIRKITPAGVVTTLAGGPPGSSDGTGTAATFNAPNGITIDGSGNLYVSDYNNNLIRKITSAGVVTTIAGNGTAGTADGTGTAASFNGPTGITIDKAGNLYVADLTSNLVRKITKTGVVTTLAGNATAASVNGIGNAASFSQPSGTAADGAGNIYVADAGTNLIRKITAGGFTTDNALPAGLIFNSTTGTISGTPTSPLASAVYSVTAFNSGGSSTATVNITVTGSAIVPAATAAPHISYASPQGYTAGNAVSVLSPSNSGGAVPAQIYAQTTTLASGFNYLNGVAVDASGNSYFADSQYSLIRKVSQAGVVTVLAGGGNPGSLNGKGTAATFNGPQGVAVDVNGNIYVADAGYNQIRKISPSGVVTTLAGSVSAGSANGTGTAARFNTPIGVVADAAGNVYVADQANQTIRKITPGGTVTTFAGSGTPNFVNGTGTAASFDNPGWIAIDAAGNLYVTDVSNDAIRKITPAGVVTTLAGGTAGFTDGTGAAASFSNPQGIVTDQTGNIYVADKGNNAIRRITPAGVVTTIAGFLNGNGTSLNGIGVNSGFYNPNGIAIDAAGNLYVSEYYGGNIRKVSLSGYALAGNLPPGLTFDATTGNIGGTPTLATAAANYSVTAYNAGGGSTALVNIAVTGTITPPPPSVAAPVISYATPKIYAAGTAIAALTPTNTGGAVPTAVYAQTSTIVPGIAVSGVVTDVSGNIYVSSNNQLIKITPGGAQSVLAGSGAAGLVNGTGTAATFNNPQGMVIDAAGNIYVADNNNNEIRKISPAGVVTTLAGNGLPGRGDGTGATASFNHPESLVIDSYGNIYVADQGNNLIRKISAAGLVSTLAGSGFAGYTDGTGPSASFNNPWGIAADLAGNLYVSDLSNQVIRKITPAGVVSTFAGNNTPGFADGTGTAAIFYNPVGMAVDYSGNVYVVDQANQKIRKITPAGVVGTLAGNGTASIIDGTALTAGFYNPTALALDAAGNLYLSDSNNSSIRKINLSGYSINANLPAGLVFDPTTGTISGTPTLAAPAANYSVTAYNAGGSSTAIVNIKVTGTITPPVNPVAAPNISYATPQSYTAGVVISPLIPANTGGSIPTMTYAQTSTFFTGLTGPGDEELAVDASGNVYVPTNNHILKITPAGATSVLAGTATAGSANGLGTAASFNNPKGIAVDAAGNVYVADAGNNMIRKISAAGLVSTLAGNGAAGRADGPGASAGFSNPQGLAVDNYGNVYVADQANNLVRKVSPTGITTTLAGNIAGYADGTGPAAMFSNPWGVAVDGLGNVYVADYSNSAIRKVTPAGVVTTLAGGTPGFVDGTGVAASFANPHGVAVDLTGNVYVADQSNNAIRRITPAGVVTTLAGALNGTGGSTNGVGTGASFSTPLAVAPDALGNLYVADYSNSSIRKISIAGYTLSGNLPVGLAFDPTTGTISGTPTLAAAATNYSVTAYNTGGSSTTTVNIAVTGAITTPPNPVAAPNISYATPQNYTAGVGITPLAPTNTGGAVPATTYGQTTTVVPGLNSNPYGVVTDATGNLYISGNNQITKITPGGASSILAGNGSAGATNGAGTVASFNNPTGLAIDATGNIYVADYSNNEIRKVTPGGVVTTLAGNGSPGRADGPGSSASFYGPQSLAVDSYGNVYVTDIVTDLIRKISPGGIVTTFAGSGTYGYVDGTGSAASFGSPWGIAADAAGNLYVSDQGNQVIRKITPAGVVSTLAGNNTAGFANGTGTTAIFYNPEGIAVDQAGNVYVADSQNHLIRKITPAGVVSTLAGNGNFTSQNGIGASASFYYPGSLTIDASGNLYVDDYYYASNSIRKISSTGYTLTGNLPVGLAFDPTTGAISGTPTLATPATNYNVTAYNTGGSSTANFSIAVTGTITPPPPTVAAPNISYATPQSYTAGVGITVLKPTNTGGAVPAATYGQTSTFGGTAFTYPGIYGIVADASGNLYVPPNNQIFKITPAGVASILAGNGTESLINGQGTSAGFAGPEGMVFDAAGNLYVAAARNNEIRKVTPTGLVTTFAGNGTVGNADGPGNNASFNYPENIAIDHYGNFYVSDVNNNLIRKISSSGIVSTFAGSGTAGYADGTGSAASFNSPQGIAVDGAGNVFVVDANNQVIRKITQSGVVTTLAGNNTATGFTNGTGTAASFFNPHGLAIDQAGNLYVADQSNNVIRRVTPSGVVSTLAGSSTSGSINGTGAAASFANPVSIATDAAGNVYVGDLSNFIREISANGYTLSGPLPAGLSFDGTTGAISGTPLFATAAKNYTITAYNAGGSSSSTVNIAVTGTAVAPAAPTLPAISYASPQTYAITIPITPLAPSNSGGVISPSGAFGQATTFAGNGSTGRNDGDGAMASFSGMQGTATDIYGNIYVTDNVNNIIRKITPAGTVTTLAGSGTAGFADGTGTAAMFNNPIGIGVDKNSNVFVADANNAVIRKITPSGVVTTFAGTAGNAGSADGTGASASFNNPQGLAVDKSSNVYVADAGNYTIRKITFAGVVTTLAGSGSPGSANGTGAAASFGLVQSLAVDANQNVYVADPNNYQIRKIGSGAVVTTFAGSGTPGFADGLKTAASFSSSFGVTIDAGTNVYVADAGNDLIRKITSSGLVTTIAGNYNAGLADGIGTLASFNNPQRLAADNSGNLYIADNGNNLIRKVSVSGYTISAALPSGLVIDGSTGIISGTPTITSPATTYSVTAYNNAGPSTASFTINVINPPVVTTSNGPTTFASNGDTAPVPVVVDGNALVTDLSNNTLASGTVSVTGNFATGQDVLAFANNPASMGNIAGNYNATTGILSFTSSGATATLSQWQAALQAITYINTNNAAPSTANRTISFVLNDGKFNSLAARKTIALAFTPSSNDNLTNLTLSPGSLAPGFSSATTAYSANFSNSTASITLTPVTANTYAKVTVNGTPVASGSASPNVPLSTGNNTITTLVTAQDNTSTKAYVTSIIRAATQTITFAPTNAVIYGNADFNPGATSTNNTLPITYASSNSAVATISGGNIHIIGVGATTITASQAGNIFYDPANQVTQTLTVNPAQLTVTAANKTKVFGGVNPPLTYSISGFVNGDTQSVVTTQPAISTTAITSSGVGPYPITVSNAVSTGNYTISYVSGSLSVTPSPLTITANSVSKTYGAALTGSSGSTAYSITAGALQNSNTLGPVSIAYGTGAASTDAVGTYAGSVTPSAATGANGFLTTNYNITYVKGNITVGAAALTITANTANKTYGAVLSGGPGSTAFIPVGLQNAENIGSVTMAYGTGSAATDAVGTYSGSVTPSAATGGTFNAGNYTVTYQPGTIIVGAAQLTITAINVNKTYGTALTGAAGSTAFTPIGLKNAETISSITIAYGTGSAATDAAGTYTGSVTPSAAIGANGFLSSNYNITYSPGNIIVGKAALTITAGNVGKTYGTALPGGPGSTAYSISSGTLQNGNTIGSVTITYGTGSAATDAAGTYAGSVTPSAATGANGFLASNYNITYSAGTITIGKAALTITANNVNKNFGTTLTGAAGSTAYSITGGALQNAETISSVTIAYGTGSPTASAVGSYTGSVTPSAAVGANGFISSNYNITYTKGNITVVPAPLTITASNVNKTFGATLTGATGSTAYTVTGGSLKNGNTVSSITIAYGTGSAATDAAGTYTGSAAPSAAIGANGFIASNYNITYSPGNIIVGKAALTITAGNVGKTYGAALAGGPGSTAYSISAGTLQNGNTIGSVTITYGTGSAATAAAGTYLGSVTPSAATGANGFLASNYNVTYSAGIITVGKAALGITANNVNKNFGTTLTGAAGSTAYSITGGTLQNAETISSVTLAYGTGSPTASAVGSYTGSVTASAAVGANGFISSNYNITYTKGNITVVPAPLTITASNVNKIFGATLTGGSGSTAYTVTGGGLKNGNTVSSITIAYGTGSAATDAAGTYTGSVTPSAAIGANGFLASNYNITYAPGSIIVAKATVTITITAGNVNKTYGAALTGVSGSTAYTITGGTLLNGNTISSVTISYGAGSAATDAAGSYTGSVMPSAAIGANGFLAGNYNITYLPGNITIGKAALAITANNVNKNFGTTITGAAGSTAYSITGGALQNAETISSVTIAYGTGSPTASAVGSYTGSVIPSAAVGANGFISSNYNITYTKGNITVAPAPLTITASNVNKTFGTTLTGGPGSTAYTVMAGGLKNGNIVSSITIAYGSGSVATDTAGTYAGSVTPSAAIGGNGFLASNYNITYRSGNIIVSKAAGGLSSLFVPAGGEQKPLVDARNEKVDVNNILSPNGDGINDVWIVKNIAFYPNNSVTVYDKSGRVVFTKKGYTNDWDGTYRGSVLNEGTYYYLIDLGNGTSIKGFITVVRDR